MQGRNGHHWMCVPVNTSSPSLKDSPSCHYSTVISSLTRIKPKLLAKKMMEHYDRSWENNNKKVPALAEIYLEELKLTDLQLLFPIYNYLKFLSNSLVSISNRPTGLVFSPQIPTTCVVWYFAVWQHSCIPSFILCCSTTIFEVRGGLIISHIKNTAVSVLWRRREEQRAIPRKADISRRFYSLDSLFTP